ncbi:hypothetical protein H3N56_10350 [Cetobacterium sp. 2A]|uniref:hypothetical protein n=1 Tax=Cetobacterium sp. 2A TaxID=2754723 RepID=UPI00163BAAAD|nr:hypothetical protein [Cetobacterium sp. 2A]MBC2855322.1 hypothetical protein [Cetobacterium sp. 2A]MBC2856800.1 hypothetical protein [Cetobacterium sp. 2A]MBC2856841.1 hypothetical protein [Cetobacterium sp. 2A]
MRPSSIVDDALGLTMGTTGVLFEIHETVGIDYEIDALDDKRREIYITNMKESIERLEKFAIQFKDKTFTNWVKRYISFLKIDLEKQLYYEELSDKLRDKLFKNVKERKEQLQNENRRFENLLFEKNYNKLGLR